MLPQRIIARSCFPKDVVVAVEFKLGAAHRLASSDDVADGEMILDAGAESVAAATAFLDRCSTIVWNGPMGAFEIPPFDAATTALALCCCGENAKMTA